MNKKVDAYYAANYSTNLFMCLVARFAFLFMTSISVAKQLRKKVKPILETKRYRGCRL
jgi:hypothetical protein